MSEGGARGRRGAGMARSEHAAKESGARGRRGPKVLASILGVGLAAALALVPVTSASAHDYWVDSNPEPDSTVTAPLSTVTVTFNDVILDLTGDGASAVVEVTGPDGASTHFETGCPTILGRTVSAPVDLGAAGKYQVSWQIVSSDGHPVSNSISFTYAPAEGTAATPSAGSASGPACGSAVGSTSVAALPTQTAGSGVDPWLILGIAGGIVVLAIAGVVLVLVLSRRRPAAAGDDPGDGDQTGGGASGG
ncbi:copper resistance CopC family protein [Subtercola sp. YIM 133946]|uniref:copper resistance CopC family protein n=1 Tax=Subtercola sp. YIM 133946 TaxID=3118909 RepID=UPI002F91F711